MSAKRVLKNSASEEELRDIAKCLIWSLTANYKHNPNDNPHFNRGFVSLLEYLSAVLCDDWPVSSLNGFSEELEHYNFIRYIWDDHSNALFQKFTEICSAASGIDNVDALMNSSEEVKAWPTLQEFKMLGLARDFLHHPKGFIANKISQGQLYLKGNKEL